MPSLPIVLVGYGPVGALLAAALGQRGVRVIVLERETAPHALPRAAHLDDEALRILQGVGVAEAVVAAGRETDGMDVTDGAGRVLLRARKATARTRPHGHPPALLVHQPTVERHLREAVAACPSVEVRLGHAVERIEADEGGATLHVRHADGGYAIRASWVVGCDGARSTVRETLGTPLLGSGLAQPWLVVDVLARAPLATPERLVQVADPDGPRTVVPFPDPRRRWEWRLPQGADPEAEVDPEAVRRRLATVVDPEAVVVERAAVYTFRDLTAARWRRGRLLLAGDAAHQMPPFLGQGLCAGLRDADALAWRLALVASGAASPALLDAYEAERRPHVRRVTRLAARAGRFIGGMGALPRARNALLRAAHCLPLLRQALLDLRGDIRPVRAVTAGRGVRRLHLVPQPTVRTPSGPTRLDDLLGSGFSILARDDGAAWQALAASPLGQALSLRVVPVGGAPALVPLLQGADAVVIRPDRHLFGRYSRDQSPLAADDLARALYLQDVRTGA